MASPKPIANPSVFDDLETVPTRTFQDVSFQIEEFRTLDFSSMDEETDALISDPEDVVQRYVPIVSRYTKDKASHMVRAPKRTFEGLTDDEKAELEARLFTEEFDFNEFMRESCETFYGQNGLLIIPVAFDGDRIELQAFIPGEVSVERSDLMDSTINGVSKLIIRVPVAEDEDAISFGELEITADQAWIKSGAERVGFYRDDGTNPFGRIPAVIVREFDRVRRGHFWNSLPQDLHAIQIASNIALTDIDFICRFQAYGREVLVGQNAKAVAEEMETGPNRILVFEAIEQGDDLEYKMINGDPKVDKYLASLDKTVSLFENYHSLNRGSLSTDTNARTGAAGLVEETPFREERERVERKWSRAEWQAISLFVDAVNVLGTGGLTKPKKVTTRYQYIEARINHLQDEQASVIRYAFGADGPIDRIMREENLSETDALKRFVDRMKQTANALKEIKRIFGNAPIPGLDQLSSFLDQGNSNAQPRREGDSQAAGKESAQGQNLDGSNQQDGG